MNTIHHMLEPNPSPAPRQPDSTITLQVPTAQAMHELGERLARSLHGGEVILLSGPLGATISLFIVLPYNIYSYDAFHSDLICAINSKTFSSHNSILL